MIKYNLNNYPSSSGVYLIKNKINDIIYIGKAKNIKNRLKSYFNNNLNIKTNILMKHANKIDYIITKDEYSAFLLENVLIKNINQNII